MKCSANEAVTGVAVDACVIASEYATHAKIMCAKLKLGRKLYFCDRAKPSELVINHGRGYTLACY